MIIYSRAMSLFSSTLFGIYYISICIVIIEIEINVIRVADVRGVPYCFPTTSVVAVDHYDKI